ncbi:MAG: DNA mismatch repair protein msh6 [Chaenotheca gracillima]|nr:MAG: DNA mismatch repair protein msh6 [Chaenotheca gracillima]
MAPSTLRQRNRSPEVQPPSLKKSTSSSQSASNQRSILGFFQKSSSNGASTAPDSTSLRSKTSQPGSFIKKLTARKSSSQSLTPAPSSDAIGPSSSQEEDPAREDLDVVQNGLPSPMTPANGKASKSLSAAAENSSSVNGAFSSPSRKAKQKVVSYAESSGEDDEAIFQPMRGSRARDRSSKRRRVSLEDSEDDFQENQLQEEVADEDDDLDSFIVEDESDEAPKASKKRKRPSAGRTQQVSSPLPPPPADDDDLSMPTVSTAKQWTYDPENLQPLQPQSDAAVNAATKKSKDGGKKIKQKAHTSEPDQRYTWLAKMTDADRNPPGHPDFDPRSIYIPPFAWTGFSPFEKQYWEIKQKLWDTIVFFKKGKFYELYENDATIGHQLFDLKLTDRVNMRMVGVPEMSLGLWANQFVAKGFKIARVDQFETALGKEMRERGDNNGAGSTKQDKVIRRELAQVLTAGTLVDGSMLQDDMSTYCASIKEDVVDGLPAFGITFVDTATAQFSMVEFIDDVDMTKLETFVAQIRPQELLLEKSCVSVKTLRILKNNTGPTTIWNYLKPGKEFWTGDITCREINASEYFVSEDQDNLQAWPEVLREARDKELVMSSFGALLQYLRTLKIERDLVTVRNFTWYDPIRKATSLVLDGQTLINLEVFANSFDGSSTGTLFSLLNRCVTPFGKRLFRQWVCHPLADPVKINARLDAIDSLNADTTVRDQFTSQLTRMPDLERLISRIHAGSCKAQDFCRVLEGFEQIDYTMSLLSSFGAGDGVIGKMIAAMPDLNKYLKHWKTAFDRSKAKDDGILVPEIGVEEDFDESQARIEKILSGLEALLKKYRRELGSSSIVYRDNGKEIYQLEVPTKVKGVPKNWDQMSATQKVKRYYSSELRGLVRQLQEAQETHGQIVKEVAGRFMARFDQDYEIWLAAVKLIAQLDCLISLAKASSSLGEPSCRPQFMEDERSVVQFEELRHPCMLPTVADFIPNDVNLGGDAANINLLTGANAAGKSTILRMTCVAVIMAQLGCYVPCRSARLTPVDRIMSRLGANDNIFAAQSTFFVELSETQKILSEATPRSLVILDELGRGTSSYDGVAVAQAVLHHVATYIGCTGFFATHYHSLATEFADHPEISPKRMQIHVDDENRRITFLFKLENGVAEGSFGMHCAAMCGIPNRVIERAEVAAKEWEHTSRLKESLEKARSGCYVPLGMQSDFAWALRDVESGLSEEAEERALQVLIKAVDGL